MGEKKRRFGYLRITKTPPNLCLNCGEDINAATSAGHLRSPHEGGIAICFYCFHVMAFDAQLKFRELTDEEVILVSKNETFLRIMEGKEISDKLRKRMYQ